MNQTSSTRTERLRGDSLKNIVKMTPPMVNKTPCHAGAEYPGMDNAIIPWTANAALYAVEQRAVCQPITHSQPVRYDRNRWYSLGANSETQ